MRLSEIYTSFQGEGPNVGKRTTFIRFAGCNLRCPGWPCDTQHAIDSKSYRNSWWSSDTQTIIASLSGRSKMVTLTGGEPLLQPSSDLEELTHWLWNYGYQIELFTNGTFRLPGWSTTPNATVIMDWKLPGSGESFTAQQQITRIDNFKNFLRPKDAIKFVCANRDDFDTACQMYDNLMMLTNDDLPRPHIYVGAVWDKLKEGELAGWVLEQSRPFMLNVQVHNYVWPAHERGR
jgi:7-carboxy-7-deazaguanine synthase